MKNPPLIQTLAIVAILAFLHAQNQNALIETPAYNILTGLVFGGASILVVLSYLTSRKSNAHSNLEHDAEDDFDLSA